MPVYDAVFVDTELSKLISIFGLRLWVIIGILIGSLIVLALFMLSLCITSRRHRYQHTKPTSTVDPTTSPISKEIQEIVAHPAPPSEIQIEIGKLDHRVVVVSSGETETTASSLGNSGSMVGPEVAHLGWGRWYTLRELEDATNGLREENVISEGGYVIVYSGLLNDGTRVAVKNLLNNSDKLEQIIEHFEQRGQRAHDRGGAVDVEEGGGGHGGDGRSEHGGGNGDGEEGRGGHGGDGNDGGDNGDADGEDGSADGGDSDGGADGGDGSVDGGDGDEGDHSDGHGGEDDREEGTGGHGGGRLFIFIFIFTLSFIFILFILNARVI